MTDRSKRLEKILRRHDKRYIYKRCRDKSSILKRGETYPPGHPLGISFGFKDEVNGNVIDEFVGLRAKLYSYKMFEDEESKKCKYIKNSIEHEDYKVVLSADNDRRHILEDGINTLALGHYRIL